MNEKSKFAKNKYMGRGDKKSKKGKITIGSFGNSRRKRVKTNVVAETKVAVAEKPKRTRTKKAE
jgi:30S ribosomal protein S31